MNFAEAAQAQAQLCETLGSAFTARLCRIFADLPAAPSGLFHHLHNWPGDPSAAGDAVALRLAGALHALVLTDRAPALGALYPPHDTATSPARLQSTVVNTLNDEAGFVLRWLESPPQTNEVSRCSALIPAFHLLANHYGLPLVTSELGASAGLNMIWDHYRCRIGAKGWGPGTAGLQLAPDWHGPVPPRADISIRDRAGCDLSPLSPGSEDDRLRLMAYTWPDQPDRLERLQTALNLAASLGNRVENADAADWAESRLANPRSNCLHVLYHSVTWQYFPPAVARRIANAVAAAGARATPLSPFAWLRIEADGKEDGAAITLTFWPGARRHNIGRIDFHGRWVQWAGLSGEACPEYST